MIELIPFAADVLHFSFLIESKDNETNLVEFFISNKIDELICRKKGETVRRENKIEMMQSIYEQ